MKGSAAMMGATIVMVALVLSLVLLLLADLYCTLLLGKRRRRHPTTTTPSSTSTPTTAAAAAAPSLCSFYAHGVIRAPRNFLFPSAPPPENPNSEKQLFRNNLRYHRDTASPDSFTTGGGAEQLMYICNPVYDGEEAILGNSDTPFESATTSPSHLDIETGSSSGSGSGGSSSPISTPQLTPDSDEKAAGGRAHGFRL